MRLGGQWELIGTALCVAGSRKAEVPHSAQQADRETNRLGRSPTRLREYLQEDDASNIRAQLLWLAVVKRKRQSKP